MTAAESLAGFIKKAVSPFHTVEESRKLLDAAGFTRLDDRTDWTICEGGRYYVIPESKTIIALTVGKGDRLHLASAHTDFPCLHVKPVAECEKSGYMRVNTEIYGGPILNTWLDRPLSMAGRILLRSNDIYAPEERLIDIGRPVLTIPNLAVHYNREVNKGYELKKQSDMLPLLGMINGENDSKSYFIDFLAAEAGVDKEDILDFDLYVYNADEPAFTGMKGELLSAPRLDNITSCHALVKGLINASSKGPCGIDLIALLDNEEIGSHTAQGGDSMLIRSVLERVYSSLGKDIAVLDRDIAGGFLLSVDVAHALHPAHTDKYDPVNNMLMNEGVTLKLSANQRYSYNSPSVAAIQQLCESAGVSYKKFVNNADMPGGGTLGPIISSWLPMRTVDVGVPILAMHSARELMGADDQEMLEKLMTAFFK